VTNRKADSNLYDQPESESSNPMKMALSGQTNTESPIGHVAAAVKRICVTTKPIRTSCPAFQTINLQLIKGEVNQNEH
jgi:hypothetical protein